MTDFVIVAVATAMLVAGPAPASSAPAPAQATAATPVPSRAPTVGFRTYSNAASCEQATAVLAVPAGSRLVCIPIESMAGELANPY